MQEKTETLTIREVNMPLSGKDCANGKKIHGEDLYDTLIEMIFSFQVHMEHSQKFTNN